MHLEQCLVYTKHFIHINYYCCCCGQSYTSGSNKYFHQASFSPEHRQSNPILASVFTALGDCKGEKASLPCGEGKTSKMPPRHSTYIPSPIPATTQEVKVIVVPVHRGVRSLGQGCTHTHNGISLPLYAVAEGKSFLCSKANPCNALSGHNGEKKKMVRFFGCPLQARNSARGQAAKQR